MDKARLLHWLEIAHDNHPDDHPRIADEVLEELSQPPQKYLTGMATPADTTSCALGCTTLWQSAVCVKHAPPGAYRPDLAHEAVLPQSADTVTLVVPRQAAERLAQMWELDFNTNALLGGLRDLLNGQDGFLHTLNEALGREH